MLREQELYANLDKCSFCLDKVAFLSYIVSKDGIEVDEEKIWAIREWPVPKNSSQERSFHGLASFYRRFVKDFSTLAAFLAKIIKKNLHFEWGPRKQQAFDGLEEKLTTTPVLTLIPNFDQVIEIECDASGVGIGDTLSQGGRLIAYFSEKLKGVMLNYSRKNYMHMSEPSKLGITIYVTKSSFLEPIIKPLSILKDKAS